MPSPGASYSSSAGSAGGGAGGTLAAGGASALGMVNPVVFAGLAAFQVINGLHQAEIIRANAKIQKQINDMNAQFAELDAYNAEVQGYTDETRYQGIIDDTVGQIDFAYTMDKVDTGFGTARSVIDQTKYTGFLNKLEIQNQSRLKALGYRQEARNIRLGSFLSGMESNQRAKASETASLIDASRTALSGYEYSQGRGK